MKAIWGAAVVSLGLLGAAGPTMAQYGGPDYGYREREYGSRDRGYRDRDDDDYRGRGGYGRRGGGMVEFDEREYLRCNPDVRRAVRNGQMESAMAHYQQFGRREGRRLSC